MVKTIMEFLTEVIKFFNNIFISSTKQIKKVHRIYGAMSNIMANTAVQRVLITRIHNSGSLIKPNTELYASVIYEDYTAPFASVKHQYQRLPVDKEYVKILVDILDRKRVYLSQQAVNSQMVKDLYIQAGVTNSVIYFLGQDKKNIYLCSCASSVEEETLTSPAQYVPVELEINVIRQNIK